MTKETFIKLIKDYQEFQEYLDKLYDLKIDIINGLLHEYPCKLFDSIIYDTFTEDGSDWVSYYLYENPDKCYYIDKVKYPLETVDDLWNVVRDYLK